MRTVLTGMFIALAFAHWPALDALDPLVGTAAAVVVAVVIAGTVLGGLSPIVPVAGALAALSLTLAPTFGSAGALATVAIFAPRVLRARTRGGAAGMAVLASLAGGVAATVVTSYLGAATAIELTAVGVAAVVAMTPFLVPVDDSVGARIRTSCFPRRVEFSAGACAVPSCYVVEVERFPELRPSAHRADRTRLGVATRSCRPQTTHRRPRPRSSGVTPSNTYVPSRASTVRWVPRAPSPWGSSTREFVTPRRWATGLRRK
ncbi:MAG: hypothetical protein R3A78_15495 [Polyangiales bacterium]